MKRTSLALLVVLAAASAGCGDGGGGAGAGGAKPGGAAAGAARTVEVDMVDISFEPGTLEVKRGEKVRFTFHNRGKLPHDAVIGDEQAQADHEKEMREAEGKGDEHGGHGHGGAKAVTVEPGKTAELTHTFDEAGTTLIGCHQPGHYAAGMKVVVTVT